MAFEPRFTRAADEFERYRPDYPPALYRRILAEVPAALRGRAMDLGAGTGIVAGHLIPEFREVVAIEPDLAMAGKIAARFPQAIIRNETAENCVQPPESVDLITIANALHWMDADLVLANARAWLRPNGVLAVFDRPLPKASPSIDAVVLSEFHSPWKPHRDPRLKRDLVWQNLVRAAPGFRVIEQIKFPNSIPMSPQDYTGFWRSTSYGSSYAATLPDPESYWNDLQSRFAAAAGGASISVDFSSTMILSRRI